MLELATLPLENSGCLVPWLSTSSGGPWFLFFVPPPPPPPPPPGFAGFLGSSSGLGTFF